MRPGGIHAQRVQAYMYRDKEYKHSEKHRSKQCARFWGLHGGDDHNGQQDGRDPRNDPHAGDIPSYQIIQQQEIIGEEEKKTSRP